MNKYFYTFGSDPQFPYGLEDFVEVHAETRNEADQKFQQAFPNYCGSSCLNCAWVYSEKSWLPNWRAYYHEKPPVKIIE